MLVDNPGYGEIIVRGFAPGGDTVSIASPKLGRLLEQTTQRSSGADPETHPVLPAAVTAAQAATLVPSLQRAVLLAVGGTDRYERVDPDPSETPADVLGVDCGQGSTSATPSPSPSDALSTGTPFGHPTGTTWAQALATRAGW